MQHDFILELEEKFKVYLKDPVFLEVLGLVQKNSTGRIWLIGGFLYKNLANILYGTGKYSYDIDFLVENRQDNLVDVSGWNIEQNNYGVKNYVRDTNKTSFTDLHKVIRISNPKAPKNIKEFMTNTPFNIQAISYSFEDQKIIGEKGILALKNRIISVNDISQAQYYAIRKGKKLTDIIVEKANELNFKYKLPSV